MTFDPKQPLWLPQGSVRAILAIALIVSAVALAFAGKVDPAKIVELAVLVAAFYFAARPRGATA